jgi:hypothetical protein
VDVRQVTVLYCHLKTSRGLLISVDNSANVGVSVWCFYMLFYVINKCVLNLRLFHYFYVSECDVHVTVHCKIR